MLNDEEKYRYNRHLILDKVGTKGQEKLKAAGVLVVGAGGLGCPVLQYLTAAGVGRIGIVDFDTIDKSNLQRQILFTTQDVGKSKVSVSAARLQEMNPLVNFDLHELKLTAKNVLSIFESYDIIIDGTDNFSTRYLVNDATVILNKPLIYGSIFKFEGQVSVFNYKNGPSYRCLFPVPPTAGSVPNCSEIGVIGVLPGIIGTQQANEAIKIILNIGDSLSGRLLIYDALKVDFTILNIKRNEDEIQKIQDRKESFEDFDYDLFCGIQPQKPDDIEIDEFRKIMDSADTQIIDIREDWEQPRLNRGNVLLAPMNDIEGHISEISKDKKVVIVCQSGKRSRKIVDYLKDEHNFENLLNLNGGLNNYGE